MIREQHEEITRLAFGRPYTKVHIWLDELFEKYSWWHRGKRHTEAGIRYIKRNMGTKEAKVARLHILCDGIESIPEGLDEFLELDYIKEGDK